MSKIYKKKDLVEAKWLDNVKGKVKDIFSNKCKECGEEKKDLSYLHPSIGMEPSYACVNQDCNKSYKGMEEKKTLDELVDSKGGKLQGDKHIDQVNKAASSILDTDTVAHMKNGIQGSKYNPRTSYMNDDEETTLGDVANKKMKKVVEDILSKRKFDKDVIDKVKYSNGIPEVDVVKEQLPVLVRKIAHIKTLLDREEVGGDEKAILLNSLLSVNLTDIPAQYKRELARKLGY